MVVNIASLIKELKASSLYAECPCGEEFKLSDAVLFDGTKDFPDEVLEVQKALKEALKARAEELKKRKKLATERAEKTATAVNIGKRLEVILPTLKDFAWDLPDCRFLGDPIDLVIFNGCCKGNVRSVNFIEIKSGQARLNKHQKAVKDAVEDKRVSYKEI